MSNSYNDPLTKMEVDDSNIEKWKNKLKYVSAIPNHLLLNMDIKPSNGSIQVKRDLYYDRVKTFVGNKSGHLLNRLITINRSSRILEERKTEYNDIMRKYNKSIKEYKDKDGKTVVVRMVLNKNKDKMMAYLQYYNYKKHTKDEYDKKSIIAEVQDYILKHQIYGLYVGDLMMGFLVIKKSRAFNIDGADGADNMVDTFYIQEVFIDTNMRGKKLGKILIDYALLLCPTNKKYISLMTYEGNIMARIATDNGFTLQKKPSVCPVNRLLFIRTMADGDFSKNTNRITASAASAT
jgi:hypothetical protein